MRSTLIPVVLVLLALAAGVEPAGRVSGRSPRPAFYGIGTA